MKNRQTEIADILVTWRDGYSYQNSYIILFSKHEIWSDMATSPFKNIMKFTATWRNMECAVRRIQTNTKLSFSYMGYKKSTIIE